MALPTFLICGTQKGGTSSLFYYLKEHPEIWLVKKKEVHYFDLKYSKSIKWYERHFNECKNKKFKKIGEATPAYMYFEEVPERIKDFLPEVKLIFILRNPVDRAYSHYRFEIMRGRESLSFKEAIKKEEERLSFNDFFSKYHYSYKDRGKYVIQLKRFEKYFSKKQMLIVINEEFKEKTTQAMKRVFEFLEIDPDFTSQNWHIQHNKGKQPRILIRHIQKLKCILPYNFIGKTIGDAIDTIYLKEGYPPMEHDMKNKLFDYFKIYNKELEEFLGRKIDKWHK